MSREQWGHGYHKGVQDANDGIAEPDINIPQLSKFLICEMCVMNYDKSYDRSVFSVKEFATVFGHVAGVPDEVLERVYKHILINKPLGCYISGNPRNTWIEDTFILPLRSYKDKEFWLAEADKYSKEA